MIDREPLRTMSPEEFRAIREGLTWTQERMAAAMNVRTRTVQRWESGDRAIEGPAVPLAERLKNG